MGMDICFYRDGEEGFYLRNHDVLFAVLTEGSVGEADEDHSDFYVKIDTLAVVVGMIEVGFDDCGLTADEILADIADAFYALDARDTEWKELLRYYPSIVALLTEDTSANGPLICS